jgi:hypothetical protein
MSISAISRIPSAAVPNSSAAFDNVRPPAAHPALLAWIADGAERGELAEIKPDIGETFLGLSYNPKASSSTIQTFEKLMRL